MRLTVFLLFVSVFGALASDSYSQVTKISIEKNNSTVKEILSEIENNSKFRFFYSSGVDVERKASISTKEENIRTILTDLFDGTNVKYDVRGRQIALFKDDEDAVNDFSGMGMVAMQQQKIVSGKVTDSKGEPLPGVTVVVKGTTLGVATDIDGNFSIVNIPDEATLRFTFVGMKTQEIEVKGQTSVNVIMQADAIGLEEVVAIGYGTVKKKDLTGAVSSVKAEEIIMSPVTNAVEAIQGRVAGMDISRSSGKASASPSVLLRGNRSLTASSSPLYIIDGIAGSISNLNPNDIESIDVLKDASSTAIYGSAGANGVIIVTTKQAKEGRIQVSCDAYVSVNSSPSYPSALQGDAWLDYLEEGYYATEGEHSSDQDELLSAWGFDPSVLMPYIEDNKWVDWVDETLQTGIQQNYAVSVRGGTKKVQAGFSFGYNKTEGVYKNDNQEKMTMRGNTDFKIAPWIKAGVQTGLIYRNVNSRSSRINKTFGTVPLGDVYDENGDINQYPIDGMEVVSLLANDIDGTYENNKKTIAVTLNPYVELTLMEGLTLKSILGTSLSSSRQGVYNSDHTYMMLVGSSNAIRNATYSTGLYYGYTWENILNYDFTVADDHKFTTTLITSWADSKNESSSAYNEGFLYDDFSYYNLASGVNASVSSGYSHTSKMSFAGRLNYSYKGKYLLTGSVRYDGASQLADKWDIFPAGAIAWRISEESFMDNTQAWLSNLKLRVGYGVSGNSGIDAYSTLTEATSGSDNLNLGGGQLTTTVPTQVVGNPDLGWEKSYNLNIGLDFGLFGNRVDGSVEWYDTDTRDVIYARSLPFSSGGYTAKSAYKMYSNIAAMRNKGIEISINSRNIQTKDFSWSTSFTFARNWEEVTSIDLGSGTTVDDLISLDLFMGSPKNTLYGYKKIGIWQKGEEDDAAVFGLEPGDVKIKSSLTKKSDGVWEQNTTDDDGNAVTNEYTKDDPYTINATDDRQILGQESPKWTAGLQNTFRYKNIDLSIFMTARWGQSSDADLLGYFGYGKTNLPDNYNYWTESNPTNDFPRPYLSRSTDYSSPTNGLSYVNSSYFKVKNITLGYNLPSSMINRIGLSKVRVYGTVYNSLIVSKSDLLDGLDPETGGSDSFPLYKQVVFGVNVMF